MTAVLLIADTARVQRVFADLESKGVLQLHAAATLAQVDQVLAEGTPAFTFVQSRISGLSTAILLRHLKRTLPASAKIVLLTADSADLPPLKATSEMPLVDLRLADDVVAEMVACIVAGTGTPKPGKKREAAGGESKAKRAPQPKKGHRTGAGKRRQTEILTDTGTTPGKVKQSLVEQPPEQISSENREEAPQVPHFTATALVQEEPGSTGEAPPEAPLLGMPPAEEPEFFEKAPESFLEMMEAATSREEPEVPLTVEDRVCIYKAEESGILSLIYLGLAEPADPPEPEPAPRAEDQLIVGDQVEEENFGTKGKRPLWPFVLLLALFVVPSTAYLLGRIAQAPEREARQQSLGGEGALHAAPTFATPRHLSATATETAAEASLKKAPSPPSGLAALPCFLEGLELDRGYRAKHPGWERYLGAKAEYKVFREAGRYRAIQAIARGDEIPDQLFKRVLIEFGGIAGYAVKSTEAKGRYLVEQATGSGSASLTIYRKIKDGRIKGAVVYYH